MRKRFTKDEQAVFVPGTAVEWRNGGYWHPGTITGTLKKDEYGFHTILLVNHATTRTVGAGNIISGTPTAVRLPPCSCGLA